MAKKARPYTIHNPINVGVWMFRVHADRDALEMLRGIEGIQDMSPLEKSGAAHFYVDNLYDIDDVWLDCVAALDAYCSTGESEPDPQVWDW